MKKFSQAVTGNRIFLAVFVLSLVVLPPVMPNNYWQSILAITGVYVMLSLGLNIVAGFTGLLDLSYVAFFGIGGYAFAFLSSEHFGIHLPFLLSVPVCALVAMACGFFLGLTSIRLNGDYLAIVTLAFSQIFKLLLLNLDTPVNITGGVNGIFGFDMIRLFSLKIMTPAHYSTLIWTCALMVFIIASRLGASRFGLGWNAIREDELAAETIGVPTTKMKLLSFASGAFVAGFSGAVFASFQDSVFPNNFDFQQLVVVYCMVIIGGMGNIYGVVAGAVVLSILPEVLREYGGLRMMIYGASLVAIMVVRPKGLFSAIPGFTKKLRRPDKDNTGVLRASTDLYYPADDPTDKKSTAYAKTGDPILEVQNLKLDFGGLRAIDHLDFTLHKHEILSIIGPNGAGKSTLFNVISGIYHGDGGKVIYRGKDISQLPPHKVTRVGIARTFQNLRLFNDLSVLENVKAGRFCRARASFFSALLNLKGNRVEERETSREISRILSLFGKRLTGYRLDQKVCQLSYANRRRVEIARAMATGPKVLLLDEPSAGMNPQETEEITQFIKTLRNKYGYTILLIEHKLGLVKKVSDRVIALDYGQKICEGDYQSVSTNPLVVEAYLGKKGNSHA